MAKIVSQSNRSGDPNIQIITDDSAPAVQIVHEGSAGNAIEIIKPDGTVLFKIDSKGPDVPAQPSFHGLLGWTFEPTEGSNASASQPASGTVYLHKIGWQRDAVVTNILYHIGTAGATLTAGQNFVGIINSSGTLLGQSADQSSAWTGSGLMTTPLAVPTLVPAGPNGFIWVALLSVGTTPPKFAGISSIGNASLSNAGLTVATARVASAATGQTALGNITPASNTFTGVPLWFGLN